MINYDSISIQVLLLIPVVCKYKVILSSYIIKAKW